MSIADEIFDIFEKRGANAYLGEPVTQLEHALQAAQFAVEDAAPGPLVVAALVHDIGHLIEDVAEDTAERGIDAHHEVAGQAWLGERFPNLVGETVLLHVAAKRYLCATDPAYFAKLSPASALSLKLQGGPMSSAEVAAFQRHQFFKEAVQLRHWDDRAKIEGLPTAPITQYREVIERTSEMRPAGS